MIFTADELDLIQQGKKTMFRLPVNGKRPCRYRERHAYSPREAGSFGTFRVTVMKVRQERLGDLDVKDAQREGAANPRAYFDRWRERHGTLDLEQQVHVVSIALGDLRDVDRYLAANAPAQVCGAMVDDPTTPGRKKRCGRAFSDDPVPQTVCKCGARRPDLGMDDIGYTTSRKRALTGEPPAVPAEVQDALTKKAHENESAAAWAPIHGPAERIASELPEMRANLAAMKTALAENPDQHLKREVDRLEKAVKVMEKALDGMRDRIGEAA